MDAQAQSIGASRIPLVGLLLIQIFVGYEWFNSGLTKIVRGGFPSGLSADLHDRVKDAPGWYRSFIDGSIIPHGITFGYLIEFGEFLVGAALIVAAVLWLFSWERLPDGGRLAILATTIVAALGATFMAVNFHLANGGTHPWLIPKDGFDESVDLDSLLPMVQLVFVGVSIATWRLLRMAQTQIARANVDFSSAQRPLERGV
jgi:hypothetical protein